MQIREEIFHTLEKVALTSNHKWAKLAAAIVHRGKIISLGTNKTKSHPFQSRFAKNSEAIYPHAENDAIINALKLGLDVYDLERTSLYILRIKHPEFDPRRYVRALARPCEGCMRSIKAHNLRNVIYTTEEGYEVL